MADKVSIVKCDDYSRSKECVMEALSMIGGLKSIISEGDRVLLKPNVLAAREPEDAVTTHPSIVAAMCELVKDAGGIPVIGDGAGITKPGATAHAFRVSGIEDVAKSQGVRLLNFQTEGYTEMEVPDAMHFSTLHISKAIKDADVIISLPKMKTHELTYYTGAVKNMFGVLPLKTRKEMHLLGDRKLFGEAVADLYSIAKPHLAVMDAVLGMEGNGPSHGTPIKSGVIMASYDCVSLDVIASGIMGVEPMNVPTTVAALEHGFGNSDPEVIGIDPKAVTKKYQPSSGGILFNLPPFIIRFFGKQFEMKPKINTSKCVLCGACSMNCSVKAIDEVGDHLEINKDKCIMCYCCRELCPANAVDIDMSFVAKIITTIKR
ncbi:DUF362 domain-containing protein [Methanolobus bombayensis]|uniref:DUF362 domain-containing protein n=1 Tax=Methanolobus bombayensis TaxID=38023 RepID=UPI001AE7FF04|nr:DUF362 domain-containing protein [Methanolobus bombayensis]MBP1907987.1 uncharacterized protein (DUF362 family)/Pyruvate/2-oxoacid:ferredoxin oxidoreductase delta subunit [Methanolobus bombayensis]